MHTYTPQKSIHVQSYTHIQYMCTCQSIMTWEAAFPHTCTSVHEYPDILPVRMGSLSVCVCVCVCVCVHACVWGVGGVLHERMKHREFQTSSPLAIHLIANPSPSPPH